MRWFSPNSSRTRGFMFAVAASLANVAQSATYFWLTPLLYYFKNPESDLYLTPLETTWLIVLVDLANAIFSIPVGFLADVFGRKPLLCAASPISAASWLLVLFFPSKGVLFAVRALQGMSISITTGILPVYSSEVASVDIRGCATSFVNTQWYMGIVYINLINLFCGFQGLTWFTLAPYAVTTIIFFCCPETPYWFLLKNRKKDAINALALLRGRSCTDILISDEIKSIDESVQKDKQLSKGIIRNLVFSRKDRKSFLIVEGITVVNLMVGVSTIPVNANETIATLSRNIISADYVALILGVVLLLMGILSALLVDHWGRRPILLLSSAAAFFIYIAASIMLYYVQFEGVKSEILTTIMYLTILIGASFNAFGVATLQHVLVGELFPTNARSVTTGITYTVFTGTSVVSLALYSYLKINVGIYANFVVFAVFSAIGYLLYLTALPETKGKTFREIQDSL